MLRILIVCLLSLGTMPLAAVNRALAAGPDHLVVSEVVTGGTSASDELIELYNPTAAPLPLEGLELVYVSASGATVTRRAAWDLGAPEMPPGSHVLVANELGIYAGIADVTYASGMAATGGSVAIRIQGAAAAIDAVGWGTSASTWQEGTPAPAPPAGGSIERLPGGTGGSTVDTEVNAADFAIRTVPDPQNARSSPVPDPGDPGPTATPPPSIPAQPTPTASPTPTPTSTAMPNPSGTPSPTPISIAIARALPDDSVVTIEGDALTDADFTDGGGYVADASGGMAILLDGGSFLRDDHLIVRGTLDDRFAQRTIRAEVADVTVTGPTVGVPAVLESSTGAVNEALEARLVRVDGIIRGSPTLLSGGLAFEVDDGSGPVRVIVGSETGIDATTWASGVRLVTVGVVGQRDSSGTGSSGYRVQPRDTADVEVVAGPTPGPSTGESPSPDPTATPQPSDGAVISIAEARAAAKNARVTVRGVVTLTSGTIDPGSAVIQDASGAILLRLGDDAGSVSRGELVEVAGARSTKGGMDSLRVTVAPRRLGSAPDPGPRALRTGDASEASEAQLVVVRGSLVASARRVSSGTVSFEIDDGSGPLRIVLGARLQADHDALTTGTWVEVRGVLGQETTGAQPLRGYRVWPRSADDLRILAGATDASAGAGGGGGGDGADGGGGDGADGGGAAAGAALGAVGSAGLTGIRVGATLVASAWPELGVGGLLWDGERLVGLSPASGPRLETILDGRVAPLALEMVGLREEGEKRPSGLTLVTLGANEGDTTVGSAPIVAASGTIPGPHDPPRWVSVVGQLTTKGARTSMKLDDTVVALERLCRREGKVPDGATMVVGVALPNPPRIVFGCDGLRPAPALTLALAGPAAAGRTSSDSSTPEAVDADASATSGRRLIAAVLLAIGVGIVAAAMVATRRSRLHDRDDPVAVDTVPDEPAAPGPQLTLVRVPNEHGP
ncbi:MAG: hypothetical protein ACR2GO_05995 [Candidatus Limnocylindria bacterium]